MRAVIKSDECLDFVLEKMRGTMLLDDGFSEVDEIEMYKRRKHINFFTMSQQGFLCLSEDDDMVFIHFAWYDKTFTAQKEMVRLGKQIYKHYTVYKGKPIYYSGLKDFYHNHSTKIEEGLWLFEPK